MTNTRSITSWEAPLLLAGIIALTYSTTAIAQEPAPAPSKPNQTTPAESNTPEHEPFDLLATDRLTGDWGGVRTWMEDQGITLELYSVSQMMVNTHGGLETKNGIDFGASYDLKLELDLEKMKLITGGSILICTKGTSGGEASDFDREKIGGLFATNGDARSEEPIYIDKWWYRQMLFDNRLEVRLGCIKTEKDLFDTNTVAGHEDKQFLNRALVSNPTIDHQKGLGIFVKVHPVDWLYIQAAANDPEYRSRRTGFDTSFHGNDRIRLFTELGLTPTFQSANGKLPGKYLVGSWYNPRPKTVFHARGRGRWLQRERSGDMGFYFGMEQLVWKENDAAKDKQGLSVFARYGHARGDVNDIEHFWSTGAQYAGLIPGRDKDVLGLGIAQGIMSEQYRNEIHPLADRETVCELYYAYRLTPWCTISPDLQYVTNAGGNKDDRNAFVAGLRVRLKL